MTTGEGASRQDLSSSDTRDQLDRAVKVALLQSLDRGRDKAEPHAWLGIPKLTVLSGIGAVFLALLTWALSIQTEATRLSNDLIKKAIEAGDEEQAAKNLRFLSKLKLIPISEAELERVISDPRSKPLSIVRGGAPAYTVGKDGRVSFLDDWEGENIKAVRIPQLVGLPMLGSDARFSGDVRFHKDGIDALRSAFEAVEKEGLRDRLKSFDGAYVPRTMRGGSRLSAHATGQAFDINCRWNVFGKPPVEAGGEGSVLELVPIFEAHGFRWGNRSRRPDGCHFQFDGPDDRP